jgi:multidrug transporter EmrE-like cation transporter
MHIIPHNLLSDEHVWAHSCCLTPPIGQEKVPHDEAHGGCCDVFVRGLGRRLLVNFGLLDCCFLTIYLFIYFVQNFHCIIKLWHSFLCHYSSFVWDLVPAHLVFMFAPGLVTLKSECDNSLLPFLVIVPITIASIWTFCNVMTELNTSIAKPLWMWLVVFAISLLEYLLEDFDYEGHLLIIKLGGVN